MTSWLWALIAAPFVGSFLSVLVVRLPEGRTVVRGRSACPACGATLGVRDLVPLVSWIAARGRCRHCGARVAAFYPAIELAALGVAGWAAAVVTPDAVWPSCILGWALLALAVIDYRHFFLPDVLTLPLVVAGLGVAWWIRPEAVIDHAIGAAAGFLALAVVGWAYRRLRGREGLGLGDAKLLAAGGAWVGWPGLAGIVLWGTASALIFVLVAALRGQKTAADTRVAFGSHLALGIWLVWLYGPPLVG